MWRCATHGLCELQLQRFMNSIACLFGACLNLGPVSLAIWLYGCCMYQYYYWVCVV